MLHVVTTGAYYPPVVTTWKILTTGASQFTAVSLCNVMQMARRNAWRRNGATMGGGQSNGVICIVTSVDIISIYFICIAI